MFKFYNQLVLRGKYCINLDLNSLCTLKFNKYLGHIKSNGYFSCQLNMKTQKINSNFNKQGKQRNTLTVSFYERQ